MNKYEYDALDKLDYLTDLLNIPDLSVYILKTDLSYNTTILMDTKLLDYVLHSDISNYDSNLKIDNALLLYRLKTVNINYDTEIDNIPDLSIYRTILDSYD